MSDEATSIVFAFVFGILFSILVVVFMEDGALISSGKIEEAIELCTANDGLNELRVGVHSTDDHKVICVNGAQFILVDD